jgi:hypothetical protein
LRIRSRRGFLVDHQLLGIGHFDAADDVQQRPVRVLVIDRLVERDVRVERDVLLAGRGLDGGDDLSGDAQLGERPERRELVAPEVADRLIEAYHPFLDDILAIRPDQEVGFGFDADEVPVLGDQEFGGPVIAGLRAIY